MKDIRTFLANLPNHPGVYQMLGDDGRVLYVGKARNLKKRVSNYFSKTIQDTKTGALLKHIHDIAITVTHDENEALLLESNLIKKHKPHYNVIFRDDKSYPYILITQDTPYPRIDFYRGPRKGNHLYFGPYPSAAAVRETIHIIEKIFQLRTCREHFFSSRKRPCLQHQIGRCSGSCVGLISEKDYQENVRLAVLFLEGKSNEVIDELNKSMEKAAHDLNYELAVKYRNQIARLREIQSRQYVSGIDSNVDVVALVLQAGMACLQLLTIRDGRMLGSRSFFPKIPDNAEKEEIISSFISQYYLQGVQDIPKNIIISIPIQEREWLQNALKEKAQHKVTLSTHVRGERQKWLQMALTTAKESIAAQWANKTHMKGRFEELQNVLHLKHLPLRIECFDISHSMGEATVGSCVVFNLAGPLKSDYRRYNVTGVTAGDDVGAMKQVLSRRFKKIEEEAKIPDVLLIDGGKTQLNIANEILKNANLHNTILIGVAKGVTRKPGFETLYRIDEMPLQLSKDSPALHLIQQIRDEAHRFAITGHRNRRDKARRTSSLEAIPGIGAKRRRELLRHFGGIQAINRASLDEIAKVPGISRSLAQRIFENLHHVEV